MSKDLSLIIKFGTPKHRKILEALNARKKYSWDKAATKRERWAKDEERHQAYIPTKTEDELRKTERATGTPQYTTIEIPYSYGLLMAAHTYFASIFLGRTPVLQFDERHGLTAGGKQSIEALMDYQTNVGGHLIPYFIWLHDCLKYGVGCVGHYWDEEEVRVARIMDENVTFAGFAISGKTRKVKKTITMPGYVGNRLYGIRPQDFIFDPRVSMNNFQQGEFAGRYFEISWLDVVSKAAKGDYFNTDMAKKVFGQRDMDRDMGSTQVELPDITESEILETPNIKEVGVAPAYEMVVKLIPRDWELGDSTLPEKWVFTVVRNRVIIGARPLGELHDKFPYGVIESEIDGHALFKRSMYQIVDPLSDALTWLVNTHFFNVRKSLNNMFVYDPLRVNSKDFKNPEAGLGIRLKPAAYGTPIDNMIKQFSIQDVTRSHLTDTNVFMQLMQQILGINEGVMGQNARGGRRTAAEVRGSTSFSVSRLKTQTEYISAMGWAPLSQNMLQSTQQHYDMTRKFKIAGDLLPNTPTDIEIKPENIAGFYDFVTVDGTMPVDKFALASLWKEIMMGIVQIPSLGQRYDMASIFEYTAQLGGAKNVRKFRLALTQEDELVKRLQSGDSKPIGGAGAAPGSAPSTQGRPTGLDQPSGLGPLG